MKAVFSYDNPCLFNIYSAVSKIFTDNKAMVRYLEEKNGFDNSKIKVHYQPIRDLKISDTKKKKVDDKKLRVLWAGRIVPEKLPDLVVEISKNVNSEKVSIDVYGEIDKDVKPNIFSGISALKYCGPYDGFNSLPIGKYDVLLYTSLNDGMPNVILEAAAVGLPIIASDDGGVGEFVMNEKTGLLIKDYLNYRPYVEAIDFAIKNQDLMYKFAKNAQNLLVKQHGWDKFVKIVKEDIG